LGTLAVSKDENGDPVLLVTQYGGKKKEKEELLN